MPGVWNRLQGLVFGGAIGAAASDAIRPVLEPVRQRAWQRNPYRVLEPGLAARLHAQGLVELDAAQQEAARNGYDANRLGALVRLAQTAPGVAEALALYRRQLVTDAELEHAFAKAAIEPGYWKGLKALAGSLLSPAEVANAVQQGHLPNEGILPDPGSAAPPPAGWEQPTAPDGAPPTDVPLTQLGLDPIVQAAGSGTSLEQLQVLANLAGLPPGAELLLQMRNRNVISEDALDAGLREGHLKTKWLQAFKRMRWWVPSPQELAAARLRTWLTKDQANELGALHGVSPEFMELLFLNRGRPASPTQMWRAWARKAKGPRGVPTSYEDHAKAIAISDIRPEYAELLWEIRFSYPSLFQLTRLVEAGTVTPELAATWAEWNLYGPEVVAALKAAWAIPAGASTKQATKTELDAEYQGGYITQAEYRDHLGQLGYKDAQLDLEVHLSDAKRVRAARERVIGAIGDAYRAFAITDAEAVSELGEANVTGEAATGLMHYWGLQRRYTVRNLTPKELVKAIGVHGITEAQVLDRLGELGYSDADAATLVAEA